MAIIEEIEDEEPTTVTREEVPLIPTSAPELAATLRALSAKLALPEELLPSFLNEDRPIELIDSYRNQASGTLESIQAGVEAPAWDLVPFDDQAAILSSVVRLYGEDAWTSPALCRQVDGITSHSDRARLGEYLLSHTLRDLFSAHPSLSTSMHARARPAGGNEGLSDLHEAQACKSRAGWGCHNALRWAAHALDDGALKRAIPRLLPPTLSMMDDWEPMWRERGAWVLRGWVGRIDPAELARRGLDTLLIKSLVHSLSLHNDPPLEDVLPAALLVAGGMQGEKRAQAYIDIVENALVAGWAYAPSGDKGRGVLIDIAKNVEAMCSVLGTGIVRWLKSIIPALLEPLQYPPTAGQLPLFVANLSALLTVLRAVRETGRAPRWRGQILDVLARLWVQLGDRASEGSDSRVVETKTLVREIIAELEIQCPSVRQDELASLVALDPQLFSPLVAPLGA